MPSEIGAKLGARNLVLAALAGTALYIAPAGSLQRARPHEVAFALLVVALLYLAVEFRRFQLLATNRRRRNA